MSAPRRFTWLRTSDAAAARSVRALRRLFARFRARREHGSVVAAMEATVAAVPQPPPRPVSRRTTRPFRVIELSTYPLHPAGSGGPLRGLHLAKRLAEEPDVEVVVISTTTEPALAGDRTLGDRLREITVACSPDHLDRVTALRLLSGPVSITDIGVGLMWPGLHELSDTIGRDLADASAVILIQPYLAPAALRLGAGVPIVADEHNDEWVLKKALLPRGEGGRWLLDQVDRIERSAVESAALLTAVTEDDVETLGRRYRLPENRAVVPNGADTAAVEFTTGVERGRRKAELVRRLSLPTGPLALFVGSGHLPNIEAGRRIAAQAAAAPDVTFLLAGRHSSALGRRVPGNVVALGPVESDVMDLLLGGCDVALNPMESGSGSNLKLLTYLAAGLPVVSSAVGARGIDATAAGVFTCGIGELASAVLTVLSEPDDERAHAGRAYVVANHDWSRVGSRFVELCRGTVLT